jgi:two-component system, cell cycle sensor histidine kinase PleC
MATEESYPKLISLAVHELRTPASVVSGYLRMLERDTESPLSERQRKMIEEANKSCARLVALIAELSDLAKLDDGSAKMVPRPIDLFSLLDEVAKNVHNPVERDVRLELEGLTDGATMSGDVDRLRAAFSAIFIAILREKAGPAVVVAERRIVRNGSETSAVVIVADAGRVQAAYEAPHGHFDDGRGGVGLALPIARRVIEAHGGQVWSPAIADDHEASGAALVAFPLRGPTR